MFPRILSIAVLAAAYGVAFADPISPAELAAPKVEVSGDNVILTVRPSVAGRNYKLEYSGTMCGGTWQDPGVPRVGDGNNLAISTPYTPGMPQRFYRLVLDGPPAAAPAPEGFEHIPAGWFEMGQTEIATPVNLVYVSGFYMGRTEVTWLDWRMVRDWARASGLGYSDLGDGEGKADTHPVHSISWYQMVKWCNARSEKENLTPCYSLAGTVYRTTDNSEILCNWQANGYRLPTEAEWEKAARGGLSGKLFPWGDTISHSQANYYSSSSYAYDVSPTPGHHPTYAVNAQPYTSPVGSFAANGYGLYDTAGNVWEWCWDWFGSYPTESQTDPRGAISGLSRVRRGGNWLSDASNCRVAYRSHYNAGFNRGINIGFRIARNLVR
jgi:formylglycine-generating enzyme required for sulfatase activity